MPGCGSPSVPDGTLQGGSSFSRTPTNLIGLPVTALTDKGRPAARIAVELGQDDAGDGSLLIADLGRIDRVLADHAVHDQEDFVWPRGASGLPPVSFIRHRQSASRPAVIQDYRIPAVSVCIVNSPGAQVRRQNVRLGNKRGCRVVRRGFLAAQWPPGAANPPPPAAGGAPYSSGSRPSLARWWVLPHPCRPAIKDDGGRVGLVVNPRVKPRPHQPDQVHPWTNLTICCEGFDRPSRSSVATALARNADQQSL